MAVLKKIKFGTGDATPIAQTIVTAASESVISVAGTNTGLNDDANPSYAVDLNIDGSTLIKKTEGEGTSAVTKLAVGTVPAEQVSVDKTDAGINATNAQAAFKELKTAIDNVGGAAKSYTIIEKTENLPTNVAHRYKLQQTVGSTVTEEGANIDILKDNSLLAAKLSTKDATWNGSAIVDGTGAEALVLVYKDANGTAQVIAIDVSAFLKESEFGDGLAVSSTGVVSAKLGNGLEFGNEASGNKSLNVKIDSTSSDAEGFLSVGANGVKISGVQGAIDRAIQALDFTTDAAVAGQYVAAIEETDGVVAVKARANVSDAVLTGYAKGSAPASGQEAVAATDDVKGAIAKLEHQVDAAKAAASAAHSVVEQATSTGNEHVTVTASQSDANGAITYTIGESDIASAQGLADEITRAKTAEGAIDTAVGLTKAANSETRTFTPTTNYGGSGTSAATSVMDNMQKIDTALNTLSTTVGNISYSVSGTELTFYGIPAHS